MPLLAALLAGCYDLPAPSCGFVCGADGACPDAYTCGDDGVCHRDGAPAQVCSVPDDDDGGDDSGDGRGPALNATSLQPADGDDDAPADTIIQAYFDELIENVNGATFQLAELGTGEIVQGTISTTNLMASTVVQLFPARALRAGEAYEVRLGDGITDLDGDHFTAYQWRFTVDHTPPQLVSRVPALGATGVSVAPAPIAAGFSERMSNLTSTSFRLLQGLTEVPSVLSFSSGDTVATLRPREQLAPFAIYTVALDASITDISLNPLPAQTWTFQTGADDVPPTPTVLQPLSTTSVSVAASVLVRFDEPVIGVDPASFTLATQSGTPVPATVTYDSASRSARLRPSYQLAEATSFVLALAPPIADASGNAIAPFAHAFTTGPDLVPPMVRRLRIVNGALVFELDEPVRNVTTATITVATITVATTEPVAGVLVGSDLDRTWTFTPTTPLPPATFVEVELVGGITDTSAAQNSLVPTSYTFTTDP